MKKFTFTETANKLTEPERLSGALTTTVQPASDSVYVIVTDAIETAETVTIPAGATAAFFSADGPFWANLQGATAVKPAADIVDGTGPELSPVSAGLVGETTFSLVSDTTAARTIVIRFYG